MANIMACPKCKGELKLRNMFMLCEKCDLAYPVIDGVPDMLIEDAWKLDKARKSLFKHTLKL